MKPTFGSLFAGIGGLDLGLERAGFECSWQVEIDDYAKRVLKKHFPNAKRFKDVRNFPPAQSAWLLHNCVKQYEVDIICGGFPCQDISTAGKMAGIDGERSGLWSEFKRIIRFLRPKFVLVENVPALTVRGLDRVLGDLAEIGYAAEWRLLSAKEFGAPHLRKRIFIVAYPDSIGIHLKQGWFARAGGEGEIFVDWDGSIQHVANSTSDGLEGFKGVRERCDETAGICSEVSDTNGQRCDIRRQARKRQSEVTGSSGLIPDSERERLQRSGESVESSGTETARKREAIGLVDGGAQGFWSTEPNVGRVADGVPKRVDRLRGIGNAVLPQKGEFLGRLIYEAWALVNEKLQSSTK